MNFACRGDLCSIEWKLNKGCVERAWVNYPQECLDRYTRLLSSSAEAAKGLLLMDTILVSHIGHSLITSIREHIRDFRVSLLPFQHDQCC